MKTHDLRSLQALRQLREQRASSQLVAQQQRCRDSHQSLDAAKEKLRLHREALAREAERVYGGMGEAVSVSAWQAGQHYLDELSDDQQQLESGVDEAARTVQADEQAREVFRAAHAARQRQTEASDLLLDTRERFLRRADEHRQESEDLPRAASGGSA